MELRKRPKINYSPLEDWNEIHVLARHWQSDLEFYGDEIRFLCGLIDKYFIWLSEDENINLVRALSEKLLKLSTERKELSEKISAHLSQLARVIENVFPREEAQFRNEHVQLESRLSDFLKTFREVKKQVFAVTEQVMEEEKLKRLLTP